MRKYILKSLAFSVTILCLISYPVLAANKGTGKNCDRISPVEMQNILKKINAENAEIYYIKKAPIAGICEAAIERGGQPAIFYFDIAKKYFFFGNLVEMKTMTNVTAKSARELQDKKRIDISQVPLKEALILGDAQAKKKVIIFTDPDCPYCSVLHKVIKQISEKRKDIAFYIKMFPLDMHKDAYWKSKSIVCNHSLQLLQDCFDKKEIAKTDCETKEVDETLQLVKALGLTGTPSIILPDGRLRAGALPEAELTNLIDGKL